MSEEKRAWVTLLTGNNADYLKGCVVLSRSLKEVDTKYPVIVMVTSDIPGTFVPILRSEGIIIKSVQNIDPPKDLATELSFERFFKVFTKLRVFEMADFDRVCYLDSDMLILQNIDDVFEKNAEFSAAFACICNPFKKPTFPSYWCSENCPYTYVKEGKTPKLPYFNSGLFCVKPSAQTFQDLYQMLSDPTVMAKCNFADQDILNMYYGPKFGKEFQALDYTYNALRNFELSHPELWTTEFWKNFHFILEKPWASKRVDWTSPQLEKMEKKWWDVLNQVPVGHKISMVGMF